MYRVSLFPPLADNISNNVANNEAGKGKILCIQKLIV